MTEHGTTATETQRGDSMDFFETMKSGAFCGNSGGGDTPSPSGDPHFSSLMFLYAYSNGETDNFVILYSESGVYSVPKSAFHALGASSNPTVICLTPVKLLTIPSNIDESTFAAVQFTPDSNFSTEFPIAGEITNGDGKIYIAGIAWVRGQLSTYAQNTDIDFAQAIIE